MIKQSIANRLIRTIFIFYCLIAVAVTAMHIIQEYQHTEDSIRDELISYEKIFSPVLSQALWDFDGEQIDTILTAMQEVPVIKGVRIIQKGSKVEDLIGIGDVEVDYNKYIHIEGATKERIQTNEYQLFKHQFDITYQYGDSIQVLGEVSLYSSFNAVFDRVQLGFIFLIMNALIKSVALWMIMYWLGNKIVLRPLKMFTRKIKQFEISEPDSVQFNQFSKSDYELYDLESSFSSLIHELKSKQQEILTLNTKLEKKVKKRTKELEQQKDKAEKALRVKADFLATMSHEIRTPMNGVIGMLGILDHSDLNVADQQHVQIAKQSADDLLTLINDILDISKIEAGKLTLENSEFNLVDELNLAVRSHSLDAKHKGLEFEYEINIDAGLVVRGDRIRLGQIIHNLVNNAIKFTEQGKIKLSFKAETNSGEFQLFGSVKDTGIGVSKNRVEDVFSVFTQEDASTTRRFGGSGLGLSIVKQLCEMMKGDVWLNHEYEKGACFEFSIKLVLSEDQSPMDRNSNKEDEKKTEQTLTSHKILLVEDNAINQMVAIDLLEDLGQTYVVAENGKLAIEQLKAEQDFDVILMDCQMPVMDGYTATKAIRNGDAGFVYQSIPIIAVTANAMEGDEQKCLDAGMNAYLSKPIDVRCFKELLIRYSPQSNEGK